MQKLAIDIFINFLQNPPNHFLLEKLKKEEFWQNWFLKNNSKLQCTALKLLSSSNEDDKLIASDFTSLFLSDVDYVKAPPFASFYLDENKEIYSDNSDKVKQIFAQNNFFSFFNEEPADSLINELLFISFLIKKQDDITLQKFLKEEFFTWFNMWSFDVINKAKTHFYKALTMLMQDFFNQLNT
ncbi:cytoplasmic chaperone, partial [Campylobacter jejuni]|nr:cytoplasmic chaperone [Campylobacter jejuni]